MIIFGISGKKGSGKDTVADMILKDCGVTNAKAPFAMALKYEVSKACGITMEQLNDKKSHFRLILQGWGTDFRRQLCGEDYWLKKMDEMLSILKEDGVELVIISDVRFINEFNYCKAKGARVIRVDRPCCISTDPHPSECELDSHSFDYIIRNDKTLFELECLVKQITILPKTK